MESLIILSFPDCELNSLNYKPCIALVEEMLELFCEEIQEQIMKSFSTFRTQTKCLIFEQKLSLLARLFVIENSIKGVSLNIAATQMSTFKSPSSKRRRTKRTMFIDVCLSSNSIPHFQIILKILQEWKHRLNEDTIQLIANKFSNFNIKE